MSRVIALACALLLAACAHAGPGPGDGIALPRMPHAGERVLLEIELGTLGAGQEVVLRCPDGQLIGTVSPHGIRHGASAGTYLVPVPGRMLESLLVDGRLRVRFLIERAGAEPRPARAEDVIGARAVITHDAPPR